MQRCRFLKDNKEQCSRNVRFGKLCWQHSPGKVVGFFALVGVVITWLFQIMGATNDVAPFIDKVERINWKELTIDCDREKDLGCNVNLSDTWRNVNLLNFFNDTFENSYEEFQVGFVFGGFEIIQNLIDQKDNIAVIDSAIDQLFFPVYFDYTDNKKKYGPFKARIINKKIMFYGKLYDIKTDEIIGWFDGDNFTVKENCGFTWNKDNRGVEILDKYGHVVFSINLEKMENMNYGWPNQPDSIDFIRFKGYYKDGNTYVIYDCFRDTTSFKAKAVDLVKEIKPLYDHFGKNSLGKRL